MGQAKALVAQSFKDILPGHLVLVRNEGAPEVMTHKVAGPSGDEYALS